MIEMYELNIPMFVPSKTLLLNTSLLNDVKLYPCYMSEADMKSLDLPHVNLPHNFSPNSYEYKDSSYWVDFSYFYTKKNVIMWDTPDDLLKKIRDTDLMMVSTEMKKENELFRQTQLTNWDNMINKL